MLVASPTPPVAASPARVPTPAPEFDALVAGAGPAGSTTALLLAKQGLKVGVVDARGSEPSRANIVELRDPSLDTLEAVGATDALRGAWPDRPTEPGNHHALRRIESAARDRFGDAGVAARWDSPVTGVRELGDHVAVTVRDAASGAEQVLRARYLVDATGGRLGDNLIAREDGTSVDISPLVASSPNRFVIVPAAFQSDTQLGASARLGTIVDLASGERRTVKFNLMQNPRDGAGAVTRPPRWLADATDEVVRSAFATTILDPAEGTPADAPIDRHATGEPIIVPHKHQIAPTARVGRVLLVGDAVSRVHPKTGWGTNAGIEDARRAAGTIAAAIAKPDQADATLTAYEQATMRRHADWLEHSIDAHGGGLAPARTEFPAAMAIVDRWSTLTDPTKPPSERDEAPASGEGS